MLEILGYEQDKAQKSFMKCLKIMKNYILTNKYNENVWYNGYRQQTNTYSSDKW